MKIIRFLPLAYLADTRGFFIFAAYALLVMTIALILHKRAARRQARMQVAAPPEADGQNRNPDLSEMAGASV